MRKTVELLIDEEQEMSGVEAVSLVKFPAIETDFVFFSKDVGKKVEFALDEEKRMVIGPALIPDKLIMRLDENNEEYDVYFSKETVRQIMEKFMREERTNEATEEHEKPVNNITFVESWLVEDSEKDKSALYGFNLPVGTWMIASKVYNNDVWEKVKNKQLRGYSIEGYFTDKLVEMMKGKLCKNCPEDKIIIEQLKEILLEEVKPDAMLNGMPLFKSFQAAKMYGEIFHNTNKFETVYLNGSILYATKINK